MITLKLPFDEMAALFQEMRTFTFDNSATRYEQEITKAVLRILIVKLLKKMLDKPKSVSLKLDEVQVRALQYALSRMSSENDYNNTVICTINNKLHQAIVNIS